MNYNAHALGGEAQLSVEREGLRIGSRFVDYAELKALSPLNHRVVLELLSGERIEITMLGFSYDGFWEELSGCYAARSLEALFVEGAPLMSCEGEYQLSDDAGRGRVELYPDAVCILPPNCRALRIPLCFTEQILLDGYLIRLTLFDGTVYTVGRMGYDTKPFAERAIQCMERTKKERAALLGRVAPRADFPHPGLFRTTQTELSWRAAFAPGRCAVELDTGDAAATYLYRFDEPLPVFTGRLELAMEAMGPHREIIYMTDEQLAQKPLYRMSVARCPAVSYLRAHSAGRLIHTQNHGERLSAFLAGASPE